MRMQTTKKAARASLMLEIGRGQQMISGAEFRFAFKEITREQLADITAEGNRILAAALDTAEANGIRLPY